MVLHKGVRGVVILKCKYMFIVYSQELWAITLLVEKGIHDAVPKGKWQSSTRDRTGRCIYLYTHEIG